MVETTLKLAIHMYFDTLKAYGRSASNKIKPADQVFRKEKKFISYLDEDDLCCMFCYKHLVVVIIDYYRQRPVWGCLPCRFMKGMQKIKWLDHCGDCGKLLNLDANQLADQKHHMPADNIITTCGGCLGRGNLLDEEDMENVQIKSVAN